MPGFQGSSNGKVARHGTQSGYVTHQAFKVPHEVCGNACRVAHNKYVRGQRIKALARKGDAVEHA